ncbi:MAG: cysteine peptidase family C39 domain-containing protein [Candidatus Daviesbacteria bacterium]|nr:cysteine peptidase family C39 domain-containing protein [Candidatus Daviesbacteria bacterium]
MLDIKPFQETLHTGYCGPASLKIALSYYNVEKEEKELAELCNVSKELGTNDKSLKKAAEELGFKVEIQNFCEYSDLERWLRKGVPVIVDWFTRGRSDYSDSEVADGHYSVVIGIDEKNIYLQDPEIGRTRAINRKDFMRVWFDFAGECIESWNKMIIRQLIAIYK